MRETPFQTNCRLQIAFNFHVDHQIVLWVAENIDQNKKLVKYKVTPATNVSLPFDGIATFIMVREAWYLQLFTRSCVFSWQLWAISHLSIKHRAIIIMQFTTVWVGNCLQIVGYQRLTEIWAWVCYHMYSFLWDMITYPCHNFMISISRHQRVSGEQNEKFS